MALIVVGSRLSEEALLSGVGWVASEGGVVESLFGAMELEVCIGAVEVGEMELLRGLCGLDS